jgi:hypothetical protein
MEIAMSSRADLDADLGRLTKDASQLADENDRLRRINVDMLAALKYTLPILQNGLPEAVDFDWVNEAIVKVQDAIGQAESDP